LFFLKVKWFTQELFIKFDLHTTIQLTIYFGKYMDPKRVKDGKIL